MEELWKSAENKFSNFVKKLLDEIMKMDIIGRVEPRKCGRETKEERKRRKKVAEAMKKVVDNAAQIW